MASRTVKIISLVFGVGFMMLLLISAPAQAFIISLTIQEQYIELGNSTTFGVSAEVENNEMLKIDKFIIKIYGPEIISCEFLPDGTLISECKGIGITPTSLGNLTQSNFIGYGDGTTGDSPVQIDSGYNYGYSYGYSYGYFYGKGILSYNITFDSSNYPRGMYNTEFIMVVNGQEHKKDGKALFVYDQDGLRGCSVRAQNGNIEEKNSGNYTGIRNRLNFNIPLRNAVAGQGTLLSQNLNNRLNYDFDVLGVLENSQTYSKILTRGVYRINRVNLNKTQSEIAIIYLDKKNKVLSIAGKGITATNMDVGLIERC